MLRLRDVHGRTVDLPEGLRFIEILSADQLLAGLVWMDDGQVVHVAKAGDPVCENYAQRFGMATARLVDLARESR